MADLREKNGRLEISGNSPKRVGRISWGLEGDEIVNLDQLNEATGVIVTDPGNFTTLDVNRAVKIIKNGTAYYLPIYIYP